MNKEIKRTDLQENDEIEENQEIHKNLKIHKYHGKDKKIWHESRKTRKQWYCVL